MNKISAKVLADSINEFGSRLTTFEINAPKFIDAQFEKHRMLSSNSSSSRAIPTKKLIEQVRTDTFSPISWRKNQSGMQGYEKVSNVTKTAAKIEWSLAAKEAANSAERMLRQGIHKQTVNRLLEPYLWQRKVVTATEWDNFFALRLAKDSQPEIHELAKCMKEAMDSSTPTELGVEDYHLPYITLDDWELWSLDECSTEDLIKISVARCARCSYNNHDMSPSDVQKDIALYDMLLKSKHLTPFEHIATPMEGNGRIVEHGGVEHYLNVNGVSHFDSSGYFWSGNFKGWIQYRKMIE